jgi:hypothetical protein
MWYLVESADEDAPRIVLRETDESNMSRMPVPLIGVRIECAIDGNLPRRYRVVDTIWDVVRGIVRVVVENLTEA